MCILGYASAVQPKVSGETDADCRGDGAPSYFGLFYLDGWMFGGGQGWFLERLRMPFTLPVMQTRMFLEEKSHQPSLLMLLWHPTIPYHVMTYCTIQYHTIPYNSIQRYTIPYIHSASLAS